MPTIEDYRLKITDTQKERRNFPGYDETEFYTIADMQAAGQSGTSDTDIKTDPRKEEGVAAVYKKQGKGARSWKSSAKGN